MGIFPADESILYFLIRNQPTLFLVFLCWGNHLLNKILRRNNLSFLINSRQRRFNLRVQFPINKGLSVISYYISDIGSVLDACDNVLECAILHAIICELYYVVRTGFIL